MHRLEIGANNQIGVIIVWRPVEIKTNWWGEAKKESRPPGLQNLKSTAANPRRIKLNACDELLCCCLVDMEPAIDFVDEESNEVSFIAIFMLLSANFEQWLEK